jgi:hypothetical protein
MKYKLIALNVNIGGILYKKDVKNPQIFDTEGKFKTKKVEVEAAAKAGFLELVEDNSEAEAKVKAEAKPTAKKKK